MLKTTNFDLPISTEVRKKINFSKKSQPLRLTSKPLAKSLFSKKQKNKKKNTSNPNISRKKPVNRTFSNKTPVVSKYKPKKKAPNKLQNHNFPLKCTEIVKRKKSPCVVSSAVLDERFQELSSSTVWADPDYYNETLKSTQDGALIGMAVQEELKQEI